MAVSPGTWPDKRSLPAAVPVPFHEKPDRRLPSGQIAPVGRNLAKGFCDGGTPQIRRELVKIRTEVIRNRWVLFTGYRERFHQIDPFLLALPGKYDIPFLQAYVHEKETA